ncbi:MAG: lecithin retinol acyltransferase family protein [Planctomycetaceae bacterium]
MARGDRLEVGRRVIGSTVTYAHQGIDVGDGTVVHARPDDDRDPFGGGRVVRSSMTEFAAGAAVRVRRDPPAAYAAEEIVARALKHVDRDGYCPVVDNCEHFATWCATGRRTSRQVDLIAARIVAAAGRVTAALAARAAGGAGGRVAVRTLAGTTVRLGLTTLVPAAVVGEAAALAAEWRAHQRGADERVSRRVGEASGLVATMGTCAAAGLPAGPAGVAAGAVAGATVWLAGSAAAAVVPAAVRRIARG